MIIRVYDTSYLSLVQVVALSSVQLILLFRSVTFGSFSTNLLFFQVQNLSLLHFMVQLLMYNCMSVCQIRWIEHPNTASSFSPSTRGVIKLTFRGYS